jgi:hypothetical protein
MSVYYAYDSSLNIEKYTIYIYNLSFTEQRKVISDHYKV